MESSKYLHLKQTITVAVNDADFCDRVKLSGIMGYFQDVATEHAKILGIGFHDLMTKNLVWVLSRMSFEIVRSAAVGEELTVVTYPAHPRAASAIRGFYVYDDEGKCVIKGSSLWCVLSADSHEIRRCAPLFSGFSDGDFYPDSPLQNPNPKVVFPVDAVAERTGTFTVQAAELDRNRHMNNSRYGDMVFNACGYDWLNMHQIRRFDINFLNELFVGDTYEVFRAQCGDTVFFEAKKTITGISIFRAAISFEKA